MNKKEKKILRNNLRQLGLGEGEDYSHYRNPDVRWKNEEIVKRGSER